MQPGQLCALLGAAAAAFAVFIIPLVLGPIGMLLGLVAVLRGERRGRWVIVAAAAGLVVGLLVGLLPDKFVTS
jgi:hypothetical protein